MNFSRHSGPLSISRCPQPRHAVDDAGAVVLDEPFAQGEQFIEAAGEVLVVGRDGGEAGVGLGHQFGVVVEVAGELVEHLSQVFPTQGVEAGIEEGVDVTERLVVSELAAAEMFHHRWHLGEELGAVAFRKLGNLGEFLGELLVGELAFAGQPRHFDDVNWPDAGGENVLGDLGVHPPAPFLAAPFAGEVVGREECEEQSRVGDAVREVKLPVRAGGDGVLVEEGLQLAPGAEPLVLGEEFLNE